MIWTDSVIFNLTENCFPLVSQCANSALKELFKAINHVLQHSIYYGLITHLEEFVRALADDFAPPFYARDILAKTISQAFDYRFLVDSELRI